MTATAPLYILEHEAARTPGRVLLRQGPRSTIVTEADLDDLLIRVRKGVTGIVRRAGVTLDESQLVNLYDTYFPEPHPADCDCDSGPCEGKGHAEEQRRLADTLHRMGGTDRAEF